MKNLFLIFFISILITSCNKNLNMLQPTQIASATSIPTQDVLTLLTNTPDFPPETKLKSDCLTVNSTSKNINSGGIVILQRSDITDTRLYEIFLLDMHTRQMIKLSNQGENLVNFKISPNKKRMAFINVTLEKGIHELIIANTNGDREYVLPWKKGWLNILGWSDDQNLILSYDKPTLNDNEEISPVSYLIFNPFTGEQKNLNTNFPQFINRSLADYPYWEGWYGITYNPSTTLAIYPRILEGNDEMFTYGVWDIKNNQLLISLEKIFIGSSVFNNIYSLPQWSPSGSQFVFQGTVITKEPVIFELYEVSQDGTITQLTHLSYFAFVQDSNFSWSPDEKYIAMFINNWGNDPWKDPARVALLNTETFDVTDYCISIRGEGTSDSSSAIPIYSLPSTPIWSPDGTQFLVVNWFEDQSNLILVDIEKKMAVNIGSNFEPLGWMVAP